MIEKLDTSPMVFTFNGHGKFKQSDNPARQRDKGFDWLYLHRDEPDTRERLTGIGLDEFVVDALMAEDTRPRFTAHGSGAVLILRGVNLNPGQEPTDMVSLRFWISKNIVIGVWLRRAFAVRDVIDAMHRGVVPESPADLICKIAFRLVDRAEPIVNQLSDQMDDLETITPMSESAKSASNLVEIRQNASLLRRYLAPQRDALTTFAIEQFSWLGERDQSRLKEAAERITRLGEELEQVRERAMITHDQLLAERSDRMNKTMLLLAMVTAIFLPLGLLTGILGINVGGIPGSENPYAFWIVCALAIIVAIGLWIAVRLSRLMD